MSFTCRFEIAGLPRLQGKVHWRTVTRERKRWRDLTLWSIRAAGIKPPSVPLSRAQLTFTRHSAVKPDSDNLVTSFKAIRDALIGILILDDSPRVVGDPVYRWEQAAPGQGRITVEVEEVSED